MIYMLEESDFHLLEPEILDIEPDDYTRARSLSQYASDHLKQWSTYVTALGLSCVERWLQDEMVDSEVSSSRSEIISSSETSNVTAACKLQVGEFQVCVVTIETTLTEVVEIPQAALYDPRYATHFYIVAEVNDEDETVALRGIIRRDQLTQVIESNAIPVSENWFYELPLSLFSPATDRLSFYIRHVAPESIPVPNIVPEQSTAAIPQVFSILAQKAINLATWLDGQLDDLAASLAWQPPSPMLAASGFLAVENFQTAIEELQGKGLVVPDSAKASTHEISVGGWDLEIYIGVWQLEADPDVDSSNPELYVLAILREVNDSLLPQDTGLRIADRTGVIEDRVLSSSMPHLAGSAIAETGDRLTLTIAVAEAEAQPIPLSFSP